MDARDEIHNTRCTHHNNQTYVTGEGYIDDFGDYHDIYRASDMKNEDEDEKEDFDKGDLEVQLYTHNGGHRSTYNSNNESSNRSHNDGHRSTYNSNIEYSNRSHDDGHRSTYNSNSEYSNRSHNDGHRSTYDSNNESNNRSQSNIRNRLGTSREGVTAPVSDLRDKLRRREKSKQEAAVQETLEENVKDENDGEKVNLCIEIKQEPQDPLPDIPMEEEEEEFEF